MESFYPADFEFLTQNRILQRPLLEARNYYERNRSEFERLLKKYGKLIHSGKTADVEVRRSSVHGCGLFAEKTLSKGDWIGQYTGEQRWALPFTKKTDYAWLVPAPTFPRLEINALKKGNALRFANHSFEPNASARRSDRASARRPHRRTRRRNFYRLRRNLLELTAKRTAHPKGTLSELKTETNGTVAGWGV